MNLQKYLDAHITLLKEMIQYVGRGEDLHPILSYPANSRTILLAMPTSGDLSQWVRHTLKEADADLYATIMPATVVEFSDREPSEVERLLALASEHGAAHPEIQPLRQECYVVTTGDRNDTLVAVFFVTRNRSGRIVKLTRRDDEAGCYSGNMVDLLRTTH